MSVTRTRQNIHLYPSSYVASPPHAVLVAQGLVQLPKNLSTKTHKVEERTRETQGKHKFRTHKK